MATTEPQAGHTLYSARITAVEVISAITRRRGGSLSGTDAATASSDFRYDLSHQYRVVEVTAIVISQAMELADKHALRRKALYKELRQHLGDVLSNSSLTRPIPINGCPIAPCEVANPSGSSKNSMACSLPITRSDY